MVNNYINYLNIALSLTMGFSAKDFDKIYEYEGKEFLEQEYKEFECTPKCEIGGGVFDLGIKVDLQKFKKAYDIKPKKMSEEDKEKFDEERKEIRAELNKLLRILLKNWVISFSFEWKKFSSYGTFKR